MDWYTLAVAIYLVCGVVYFALRDQKKLDRVSARYAGRSAHVGGVPVDHNVEQFATALAEQRLGRGQTCL